MIINNGEVVKVKVNASDIERITDKVGSRKEVGDFISEVIIPRGVEIESLESEFNDELLLDTDGYIKDINEMIKHASVFLNRGNVTKKKETLKTVYKLLESII